MLPASIVVALGVLLIGGLVALSWYFFAARSLLIDFTYPLISCWLIYLVLTFVNYFREQKQRQQIRSAFGFYLSPQLVEQLAKSPEKLVLGGEERRMTILFSDVRGFTTISEHYKDDPQGLTHLMNRFLTPMTNAIIERKGTIDKYIGDAIMAFWNAPLDDDEHEANACEAALEMLARAEALNVEFKREADANGGVYMPLRIGIGLNTGPCVVGNMGSDFRFNYSVLGDTVNVASRLESHQGLPPFHGHRLAHRGTGAGQIRHHGDRSDPGEGQEAAGSRVHRDRPRRGRQRSARPGIMRLQRPHARQLSAAELG
jgi:adenylate cyclase